MTQIHLTINGKQQTIEAPPMKRLLDVLREDLHLTGTKEGCGEGECGACAIILNGDLVNSCLIPVLQVEGADITTIEGLAHGETLSPVQAAFLEHDGFQCGYCTPGQLCSAVGLAAEARRGAPSYVTRDLSAETVRLTPEELRERMSGNLCRCGAHNGIIAAITGTYATEAER